jgi:hypothetical protein
MKRITTARIRRAGVSDILERGVPAGVIRASRMSRAIGRLPLGYPTSRAGGHMSRSMKSLVVACFTSCALLVPAAFAGSAGAVPSNLATAATSCPPPGSNSLCLYGGKNFDHLLEKIMPGNCASFVFLLGRGSGHNASESARNHTNCWAALVYNVGKVQFCVKEWMRPNSSDGTITPLDNIDGIQFYTHQPRRPLPFCYDGSKPPPS